MQHHTKAARPSKPHDFQKPPPKRNGRTRRQTSTDRLVRAVYLSLGLFASRAAASPLAPYSCTPFETPPDNTTITPDNNPAANVTIPFNATDSSNGTIAARGSTSLSPTNVTTNGTDTAPSDKTPVQLIVSNSCDDTIWPGIATQNGVGPGTGGFELTPGASRMMFVSQDWNGRVWGRTNCSFNDDGSGPSNSSGINGSGRACLTGDCFSRLDCKFAGAVPTTLAEFNLQGGSTNSQTFYDISLVDGYNLPLAIIYHPSPNTSWIPPNLINPACIASSGYLASTSTPLLTTSSPTPATNTTYPMPYEPTQTNTTLLSWCPFPLLLTPPPRPGAGIYPYPTDNLPRPDFQPCLSPCSATGDPADCCTGSFSSADTCSPSLYSAAAKRVCPDAYSYAFDDRSSTFVVPYGGRGSGWEVRFCPRGMRSTDILGTFAEEVAAVGAGRRLSGEEAGRVRDKGWVDDSVAQQAGAVGKGGSVRAVVAVGVVVAGWLVMGGLVMGGL